MNITKRAAGLLAAVGLALGGLVLAAPASQAVTTGHTAAVASAPSAASPDQEDKTGHTTTLPMTKVRVIKQVTTNPDSAGNVKVLLANGKTVPVPATHIDLVMKRAAEQAKVTPNGTVTGDCGSSYITLKMKDDGHPVAIKTGFHVNDWAVAYDWFATINGPGNYLHEYSSSGSLDFENDWNGGYQSNNDEAEGLYEAAVDPGVSDALLWTGDICFSGGPIDAAYLVVPKPACLANQPGNAVPSGDGWIANSTEPVPNRNKTTTPPDPAGLRASTAQACLRTALGTGSSATGDITGWQDAQIFVAANSPGTAIARCHLIANTLGGKGQILDGGQANLVPCWQVGMNTGTPSMRTYEARVKAWATFLTGPNDAVYYEVTPNYKDSTSTIPDGVTMSATLELDNGFQYLLFQNVFIPNTQASSGLNLGN